MYITIRAIHAPSPLSSRQIIIQSLRAGMGANANASRNTPVTATFRLTVEWIAHILKSILVHGLDPSSLKMRTWGIGRPNIQRSRRKSEIERLSKNLCAVWQYFAKAFGLVQSAEKWVPQDRPVNNMYPTIQVVMITMVTIVKALKKVRRPWMQKMRR